MVQDTYKYKSFDVAKYIVAEANERHFGINITKVQKLLYIIYGVFLRVYNVRLTDEHPQAWPYGPVFPTTRNKLLKLDLSEISKEDVDKDLLKDDKFLKVAEFVFKTFLSWNAGQLSEWSHSEGSPWDITVNSDNFRWGDQIQDDVILNYFKRLVNVSSN